MPFNGIIVAKAKIFKSFFKFFNTVSTTKVLQQGTTFRQQ